MRRGGLSIILGLAAVAAAAPVPAMSDTTGFQTWLNGIRQEARAAGVSERTIEAVLGPVTPSPRVIALDRRQPELLQSFWQYLDARVTPARVARGRQMLERHDALLAEIHRRYGVPPRFLVALWGLETDFGGETGEHDLAQALATLAYDPRRGAFFTEQLLALLTIMDAGDVAIGARGSWAGAMGQMQFMPMTYRDAAVDGDGDGRRDLWRSLPDVMASAANYLARSGWRVDETWGREVALPPGFDLALSGPDLRRPLAEWQALGVRRADGSDLPTADLSASLLLPAGVDGGPALLVYDNFSVIMTWNRSLLYAIAVGHLADRLAGEPPFRANRPLYEDTLSRADLQEVQILLARLGFDAGQPDGVLGAKTRIALQSFQRTHDLPADGYPTLGVIERLRLVATP